MSLGRDETGRGREVHREFPHPARPPSVRLDGVAAWGYMAELAGGDTGEIQGKYRGDIGAWPNSLGGWERGCLAWLTWRTHLGTRRRLVVGHVVDGRGGGGRRGLCGREQHRGDVGHVYSRDVPRRLAVRDGRTARTARAARAARNTGGSWWARGR